MCIRDSGRITKADIETFLAKGPETASPASTPASTPSAAPTPAPTAQYEDVPITNMRQIIGDRLLQSTQQIPSYICLLYTSRCV